MAQAPTAIRTAVMAATGAALALALTACGGGSGDDAKKDGAGDAQSALKETARKTAQQNAYRTERVRTDNKGEVRAAYAFQRKPELAQRRTSGPAAGTTDEAITTQDALYSRNQSLPEGKWLRTDARPQGDGKPADGERQNTAQGDLPVLLGVLATAKDVAKTGDEKVGGQSAAHYRGSVVLNELAQYQGDALQEQPRDLYVKQRDEAGLEKVGIDVWIGEDGLAVKSQETGTGSKGEVRLTEEYSGYGADPKIQVPAAGDVLTSEQYLQLQIEKAAGQRKR
ncbi:hypothetical protein ACFP1Z_13705 [Streptomyces gamaensis]|uniref:Lipoprotein n=1 Tax=Streptomyces gamaensis TaxID=1763542 RepID=A0ABW0YX98_9ACTN